MDVVGMDACTGLLDAAWGHFLAQRHSPGGSQEAHAAAQSAMMAAMQQGAVILQLRAVPPAQQQRAVRRAQREGVLRVRPWSADRAASPAVHT